MIEIIDNAIQLATTAGCAIWASIFAFKSKSQEYSIISCFYGTFALGLLYWLIYLVMNNYTPKVFYVSDLSWISSFLFLLMLNLLVAKKEEKGFHPISAVVVAAVFAALTIFLIGFGDAFITLIWCSSLTFSAYLSTRGLLYARKQSGRARKMQYLHAAILFIVCAEFALWLLSCFFKSNTLDNPYFWCDFVLSAGLFALMPAARKAIDL